MPASQTKARILYMYKILLEQTDKEHYLTIKQIISQLESNGISAFRKTVISDIEQLIEFGVDVQCIKSSQNRYYINNRIFSLSELKLLVDVVESTQFITQSKSAELIEKLSDLTSVYEADELCREIYLARRMKSGNEETYEVIDRIHNAVHSQKQITFQYYEYDNNKNRVLRNSGELYKFSPYGMTCDDNKYYVIGYSVKHNKIVTFRTDRMCNVEILDCPCIPKANNFSITSFVKTVFHMYDEDMFTVTLKCRNTLMKNVIDHFGMDVHTEILSEEYFKTVVEVSASKTFFGWVFQFGGDVQIMKPESVKNRFVEMARAVCIE